MRLKRLECYGFKSFADRVSFDFSEGITAVIGPNGCGKSNVVDAIKWVVGEQSAKAMRGSEMADVIFNGCATRRPMSICEVTITFEDFAVAGSLTENEVALTRSLTRDGQSNYFINGKPSRLKDLKELLMDTGVGTSAYSVIEQGRVAFILEASVKDRRAILEEAAGISRFKVRRKAALRKLERVRVDIQRISEVHHEVAKRLKVVQRQAATALRYQELAKTLKELRIIFALEEFGRLQEELVNLRTHIDAFIDTESALASKLATLEAKLIEADATLITMEQQIRDQEEERASIRSRRDVAAAQLKDAHAQLTVIDQQKEQDQQGFAGIEEKISQLTQEITDTEGKLASLGEGTSTEESMSTLYRSRQNELDTLIASIDTLITETESVKSDDIQVITQIARLDAQRARTAGGKQGLHARRERLEERHGNQIHALGDAKETEKDTQDTVDQSQASVQEAHAQLDTLLRERELATGAAQDIERQLNDMRHEMAQCETRFKMLSDIEARNEGITGGARGILQHMDRFQGIRGIVADLFSVSTEYELAIETALGGQAQNIIADSKHASREAIDFLKRERRGRATFIPLDDIQTRRSVDRDILRQEGVIDSADNLIQYDRTYSDAFSYLLGNILIVESIDHAINLRNRNRSLHMRMVTLEGEVINPGGAMTGGRFKGNQNGGLISRKNELRRSKEKLAELVTRNDVLTEDRNLKKKNAFDLAMQVERHQGTIQKMERALGEAKAQLMKSERDRLHAEEFSSSFTSELEEIRIELQQLEEEDSSLSQEITDAQREKERLDAILVEKQKAIHLLAEQRNTEQEEVASMRVDLATSEERRESLRNHISHVQRQIQDVEDQQIERQQRIDKHQERRNELEIRIEANTVINNEQAAAFRTLSEAVDALILARDALRHTIEEDRQHERAHTQERRRTESERQKKELKVQEHSVRQEAIHERILDEYEIAIAEAYGNWERPENINWDDLKKELSTTEYEFNRIGPVNLAAIDELREIEAREQFLAKQLHDLSEAAEKIEGIITKLDNTSRRLFMKTYKEVRGNFQEIFRMLFSGGKADLVLEKGCDDVLDAGIEIIAQPPGKQPRSITLLSGGEKALTAIALIFAVYRTKPSPFCILDEVDAPLDESNTDVFAKMVDKFCGESQFIVITHNKRTMQYANTIYGITHAEPGVSTKISVKLEELDDKSELMETAQGKGPFAK